MGFGEGGWHGEGIVEVGKRRVWELGTGVEDGLGEVFDFGFLGVGGFGPDKIVVDDVFAVAIAAFEAAGDGAHPCHVHAAGEDGEVVEGGVGDTKTRFVNDIVFCEH